MWTCPTFCVLSSSTGLGSCTWSVNTATSRAIEGKAWRWCRMNRMKTRRTAKGSSQRNESTSTGQWNMSFFSLLWLICVENSYTLEGGHLAHFWLSLRQPAERKKESEIELKGITTPQRVLDSLTQRTTRLKIGLHPCFSPNLENPGVQISVCICIWTDLHSATR